MITTTKQDVEDLRQEIQRATAFDIRFVQVEAVRLLGILDSLEEDLEDARSAAEYLEDELAGCICSGGHDVL